MTDIHEIERQLKDLGFNIHGWGRTELRELPNIILPDEEIFECVNGIYEGGFALLLATDVRVLLIDKKPLNYLTVEDLRFDMINEIDYSHRLFGAYIKISAGETSLKFSSINQPRLRKLIGHVQFCMAESKKKVSYHQEGQNKHLKKINQQLRAYLMAQYEQQQRLHEQLQNVKTNSEAVEALKHQFQPMPPSPELSDYLLSKQLLAQHQARKTQDAAEAELVVDEEQPVTAISPARTRAEPSRDELAELYAEGLQEIFGKHDDQSIDHDSGKPAFQNAQDSEEGVNPLQIAYSKLPAAMRNRKFGIKPLPGATSGPATLET